MRAEGAKRRVTMYGTGLLRLQDCAFEGTARRIYRFFLNQESLRESEDEYARPVHMEEDPFIGDFMLVPTLLPAAPYSLALSSMYLFRRNQSDCAEEPELLASLGTVGRIDFEQADVNRCTAALYIDQRARTWLAQHDDDEMLFGIGKLILARYWRAAIGRLQEQTLHRNETAAGSGLSGSEELGQLPQRKRGRGGRRHTGMRRETREKLVKLCKYRADWIKDRSTVPGYTITCSLHSIDTATIKRYAPVIRERWKDKSFTWKPETR